MAHDMDSLQSNMMVHLEKKYVFKGDVCLLARLAAVQFSSGSGMFWLNLNLDFKVQSGRLANPNPEPHKLGLREV